MQALEKKYEIQKMVIVQMEDRIAELYRNQTATSMATTTPESERTGTHCIVHSKTLKHFISTF